MRRDQIELEVPFAQIPRWIIEHPDLSDRAVRLYGVLHRWAGLSKGIIPGRKRIAALLRDCSVSSVDRAVKELVAAGAVTVTKRFDEAGDPTSNLYMLMSSPMIEGSRTGDATPSSMGEATGSRTGDDLTIPNLNETHSDIALAKRVRRDLTFEAVADVCGWELDSLTRQARGWINGALPELRRLDATPVQISWRAGNYVLTYGKRPTPSALVKHWPAMAEPPFRASGRELDRYAEKERLHAMQAAAALEETG